MATHALAGQPAPVDVLIDVVELQDAYDRPPPDPRDPRHAVALGTSGHRGTSLDGTFTESHILALSQAVCDYRAGAGITGPLFLGIVIQRDDGVTPTPDEPIGGLKVVAARGWFAVRPSGTEDVSKLYAEGLRDQGHLDAIVDEARRIGAAAIA